MREHFTDAQWRVIELLNDAIKKLQDRVEVLEKRLERREPE